MTSVNFNDTAPTNQQRRTNVLKQGHCYHNHRRRHNYFKRTSPTPAVTSASTGLHDVTYNPSNTSFTSPMDEDYPVPAASAHEESSRSTSRLSYSSHRLDNDTVTPTPPESSGQVWTFKCKSRRQREDCHQQHPHQHYQRQLHHAVVTNQRDAALKRTRCCWRRVLVMAFVYFLLGLAVQPAHAATCSEPGPINILARAISSSSVSRLMTVVSDENDVKGYELDPFEKSLRLLSTSSDAIFTECAFFPSEFSIVATFKRSKFDSSSSNPQYLMSLLGPDRRTLVLGFRLQRNRIMLELPTRNGRSSELPSRSTRSVVGVRDERLMDGQWHTVVVAVSRTRVTIYLDCNELKSKMLEKRYPTKLNVRRTSFFVGSVGRKTKRFTGVLRQLMIISGSDASLLICPSPNPSLASIYQATSRPPSGATIIMEESTAQTPECTGSRQGSMLISKTQELKVCTRSGYQSVRSGPERLDYIIDFEDIETKAHTRSMEWFHIPGDNLYLATANKGSISQIFVWKSKRFVHHQNLATKGAFCFKYFEIGDRRFLAVANLGREDENGEPRNEMNNSTIYRWSRLTKQFTIHQQIPTWRATSVEAFPVEDRYFLVVVDHRTNEQKNLFVWSEELSKFTPFQYIHTNSPLDITYFFIDYADVVYNCFVVANALDNTESEIMSEIFWYQGSHFVLKQSIKTLGAADWEFFKIEDGKDENGKNQYRYFLVVANFVKYEDGKNNNIIPSTIYELNYFLQEFVPYQNILTNGAQDWEFFSIGQQYYLIVSSYGNKKSDTSKSLTSIIYRWKGVEKFQPVHELPFGRVTDIDYIPINDGHYLAAASPDSNMSKLYQIITY